jgi:tetratricopeptide (TPR) repeat protein
MSLLSRMFGSKPASPQRGGGSMEERLAQLEREAESAPAGYKGTPLNRAGDVALKGGERARALAYYGRAIDTFLEDEQREAARGVANKLIRVHPEAVRTLCTLTWLDLAARHMATALMHLRDYVEAAIRVERQEIASDQIYEMARVAPQSEFLAAAADALDRLDFSERAGVVRGWVAEGGSPAVIGDDEALSAACLLAAVGSNSRSGPTSNG